MSVKNTVINPNPYGALDRETLNAFIKNNNLNLPEDYINYLLEFNGGEFAKLYPPDDKLDALHEVYGLHMGPKSKRLQDQYKLSEYYDLNAYEEQLSQYFVFADGETGGLFLIHMQDEKIYFYDPDDIILEKDYNPQNHIILIAESFDKFISSLLSETESNAQLDEETREEHERFIAEQRAYWENLAKRSTRH